MNQLKIQWKVLEKMNIPKTPGQMVTEKEMIHDESHHSNLAVQG